MTEKKTPSERFRDSLDNPGNYEVINDEPEETMSYEEAQAIVEDAVAKAEEKDIVEEFEKKLQEELVYDNDPVDEVQETEETEATLVSTVEKITGHKRDGMSIQGVSYRRVKQKSTKQEPRINRHTSKVFKSRPVGTVDQTTFSQGK